MRQVWNRVRIIEIFKSKVNENLQKILKIMVKIKIFVNCLELKTWKIKSNGRQF